MKHKQFKDYFFIRLEKGEKALLSLDGFGRKSLAEVKKNLRKFGYEIPEAAEEISV